MKFPPRKIPALLALTAASLTYAQSPPTATAPTTPAPLTFDDKGAKVGEQLPDLQLLSLDNEPINLKSQLQNTTLLVTSSFTCPKSRQNFPALADLAAKYKNLHIIILYVIEAHPAGDPSPYRNGKEDITPQNQQDGILRRQPVKIEKRLALANEFAARFNTKIPILVDPMNNLAWKSVGAGPNMAILLSRDGKVLARQGWFDSQTLTPEIDQALARPEPNENDFFNPADKTLAEDLDKHKIDLWDLLDDAKIDTLKKALAEYPTLSHFVSSYMQRGNSGGETLLQMAVRGNHLPAAKLLLDSGADPEQPTPHHPSALFTAASNGNDALLALLIPHIKHIDLRFDDGPTPMQEALFDEYPKSADLLIKAGAHENFFTHVARGNLPEVTAALAVDPSLAARPDGTARSPLLYAAATNQLDIAKLLLHAGAPITPPAGSYDDSPIPIAILHRHDEMLAFLLAAGADPNRAESWGTAPIHLAIARDNLPALRLLLKAGAKTDTLDAQGYTPLHIAAELGDDEAIPVLLDAGANINAPSGQDRTPCGPAGAPTGKTPFMLAAVSGNLDTLKLLLAKKADPALTDSDSKTALHLAIEENWHTPDNTKDVVQFLIDAKVPLNAEDTEGRTALDTANNHDPKLNDLAKLLQSHGAKPGSGKPKRRTPAQKK